MKSYSSNVMWSLLLAVLYFIPHQICAAVDRNPIDWVNPLMGTDSKFELSNGNQYPVIALPWGMNFWSPQTGKMGDGWLYQYSADKIRGIKQTHQASVWIGDYGQFSLMPVTGTLKIDEDERASWFSHKAEVVKPHYYSVYLVPLFQHAVLTSENGNEVVIDARGNRLDRRYVQEVTIDGKAYTRNWISHQDLLKGSTITFSMADAPNEARGTSDDDVPYSFSINDK